MFEMLGTMLDDESVSGCYDWHYCYYSRYKEDAEALRISRSRGGTNQ